MDNKTPKKRAAISYENMSQELLDAFKEKYPHGYADYLSDIIKVDKPDGSCFYAVSLEVPDAIYLVKIKVKVDDKEDIENGLFKDENEEDDEDGQDEAFPVNDDDMAVSSDVNAGDDPED
ncbi:MAG: hypothetical protein J5495_01760 [Bacteroidales bacterium]|nr:hypothetical protein [Bacteroidales bacterium]